MRSVYEHLSIISLFSFILFVVAACSEPPTAPASQSEGYSEVAPVLGKLVYNEVIPWSVGYFVPCANGGAGEIVLTTGNVHVLRTVAEDGQDGYHGTIHTQAMDVTGVGLTTGDIYQGNGLFREQVNVGGAGADFEGTYVNSFTLIGPGKDNNLHVQVTIHLTVNANGDITAEVVDGFTECR